MVISNCIIVQYQIWIISHLSCHASYKIEAVYTQEEILIFSLLFQIYIKTPSQEGVGEGLNGQAQQDLHFGGV